LLYESTETTPLNVQCTTIPVSVHSLHLVNWLEGIGIRFWRWGVRWLSILPLHVPPMNTGVEPPETLVI